MGMCWYLTIDVEKTSYYNLQFVLRCEDNLLDSWEIQNWNVVVRVRSKYPKGQGFEALNFQNRFIESTDEETSK